MEHTDAKNVKATISNAKTRASWHRLTCTQIPLHSLYTCGMNQNTFAAVDAYSKDVLIPSDHILAAALQRGAESGLPAHDVAPNQGKLLYLLARLMGARRILEIGILAGYSAIWLARALPDGGSPITLEADPKHAEVAQGNIAAAGLTEKGRSAHRRGFRNSGANCR